MARGGDSLGRNDELSRSSVNNHSGDFTLVSFLTIASRFSGPYSGTLLALASSLAFCSRRTMSFLVDWFSSVALVAAMTRFSMASFQRFQKSCNLRRPPKSRVSKS
jgi:hypothetical protein